MIKTKKGIAKFISYKESEMLDNILAHWSLGSPESYMGKLSRDESIMTSQPPGQPIRNSHFRK